MTELPRHAISIRQPWAWAILHAGKDVENRTWSISDVENRTWSTSFRGPICLHAAEGMTRAEYAEAAMFIGRGVPMADSLPRGGIVGTARVIDCFRLRSSRWFFGPWGLVLADVRPVDFIPCRGQLGIFDWTADA